MSGAALDRPLFVVGMRSEARLLERRWPVAVGPAGLETALAGGRYGALISFGLCGALDPALAPGDLIVGTEVIHGEERFGVEPALIEPLRRLGSKARLGAIAGSDTVLATAAAKASLSPVAMAVDMESHLVARAARRSDLPFAVLRAVSDAADETLPASAVAGFRRDGSVDLIAVLRALAQRPSELPALLRTGSRAAAGMRSLRGCAARLARPGDGAPVGQTQA